MNFTTITSLEKVLEMWRNEPTIRQNIVHWQVDNPHPAQYEPLPTSMHPDLLAMLRKKGIESLYSHQMASWKAIESGKNIVVSSGTASGKTLCYHLPILDSCLRDHNARALCVYPTKALTQDQHKVLSAYLTALRQASSAHIITNAIYDGDTPAHLRSTLRSNTNIILTNPDMLHLSILPHHTVWSQFFNHLNFVIIDELHIYRGVFGSHLANIIRRLKRVATFYGASPQFIFTSATIANPVELSEKLAETPIESIDYDGSPKGRRHFLFYNPPIVQPEVGARRSASAEAIRLTSDLLSYQVQTLIFTRARRSVEILLRNLRSQVGGDNEHIRGYRSGYLPSERRQIEHSLRTGQAKIVVATNALELGIDIGSMDASIMVGYPGSVAATRQQAGRAGRRNSSSAAIFIASASPLDQFLIQHPDHILQKSTERVLIDPNNLLILLQHIRCAAFELPFKESDHFGQLPDPVLRELLFVLQEAGEIHVSNGRYFWTADLYPANQVSLRTSSAERILLRVAVKGTLTSIGEVDQTSALWMVHPGAIYLHEGAVYEVVDLDLAQHAALLRPVETDHFTEPVRRTTIQKISVIRSQIQNLDTRQFGDVLVESQTVGYRKIRWYTNEILGQLPVDLPTSELRTNACWLTLSDLMVNNLRDAGMWVNDPINYGPDWNGQRLQARERDQYTCQLCGLPESRTEHHVHHKVPFRSFTSYLAANRLDNLITLCASCHKKAEESIRMRCGLAGLAYLLAHLSPLFIMCDINDLGVDFNVQSPLSDGCPTVCIYDQIPAGIGLSERLYEVMGQVLQNALEVINHCPCEDGCPSCVGPAGENGYGGKIYTRAILEQWTGSNNGNPVR